MIAVDVHKRLGAFNLRVAFTSHAPVTALFGQSGAGKSTLIRLIGGLLKPDAGRIQIGDRVLFDSERRINVPVHHRRLGHVFQHGYLFPHLSVRRNLLYGCTRRKPADLELVIKLLDIKPLLDRWLHSLSGGEQQRVAIGRALLSQPDALLMDEPLASLDRNRKREIMPYFERLCHDARVPILYVSHSIEEVAHLARDMVLIADGKVLGQDTVTAMLSRIDLAPLSDTLEAGAVLEATVTHYDSRYELTHLDVSGQSFVVPQKASQVMGELVRLHVRARDVSLALHRPEDLSIQNILQGRVTELRSTGGPFLEVCVDIGDQRLHARVTRQAGDQLRLNDCRVDGRPVYALVKSVAMDPAPLEAG